MRYYHYFSLMRYKFTFFYYGVHWSIGTLSTRDTGVQCQVKSCQKRKKWCLIPLCLTLIIIILGSRTSRTKQEKEFPPPQHLGVVANEKGVWDCLGEGQKKAYRYLSHAPINEWVWHRAEFQVGPCARQLSRHTWGAQRCLGRRRNLLKKRCLRRQAINLAPPRRVTAWDDILLMLEEVGQFCPRDATTGLTRRSRQAVSTDHDPTPHNRVPKTTGQKRSKRWVQAVHSRVDCFDKPAG